MIKQSKAKAVVSAKLYEALCKLSTNQLKLFINLFAHYWINHRIFIDSYSFLDWWKNINNLCYERDTSFPDQYRDRKALLAYCKKHPYYFLDMLEKETVIYLLCQHIDNEFDLLAEIANKLRTKGIQASFEYAGKELGIDEDFEQLTKDAEEDIKIRI